MAPGNQQRDERESRLRVGKQRRQEVALEVMDADHGPVQCDAQSRGHGGSHQERAGESGPLRVGDEVDVCERTPGLGERLARKRQDAADVVARGEFRHHAPVEGVQVDLRMQGVAEHAALAVVERNAGLVAGGLDAEGEHAGCARGAPFQ